MEFLIFSDSHGRRKAMETVMARQIKKPDAVFFLGDGIRDIDDRIDGVPVIRVRGNCDWNVGDATDVPEEETVCFEGHRIFLTHGHRFGAKSGTGGLLRAAREREAEIVLFGHTHRQTEESVPLDADLEKRIVLFNPGSIAQGKFGTLTLTPKVILFSHGTL